MSFPLHKWSWAIIWISCQVPQLEPTCFMAVVEPKTGAPMISCWPTRPRCQSQSRRREGGSSQTQVQELRRHSREIYTRIIILFKSFPWCQTPISGLDQTKKKRIWNGTNPIKSADPVKEKITETKYGWVPLYKHLPFSIICEEKHFMIYICDLNF